MHPYPSWAHGLTFVKVGMAVWPRGLGPHVCLDSNPHVCARKLHWSVAFLQGAPWACTRVMEDLAPSWPDGCEVGSTWPCLPELTRFATPCACVRVGRVAASLLALAPAWPSCCFASRVGCLPHPLGAVSYGAIACTQLVRRVATLVLGCRFFDQSSVGLILSLLGGLLHGALHLRGRFTLRFTLLPPSLACTVLWRRLSF